MDAHKPVTLEEGDRYPSESPILGVIMDKYIPVPVYEAIKALVGSHELALKWWSSANKAFDMKTPAQMYLEDPKRLASYIMQALGH